MREHDATLRIDRLERLNNSVNGNPRYTVHFTNGATAITSSDAGFCYAITNPEFRSGTVNVWFTKAGRIENMQPAGPSSVDKVMAVLPDPRDIGESAYRAIHDDVRDALVSVEGEGGDMVALALAELENFEDWARTMRNRIKVNFGL